LKLFDEAEWRPVNFVNWRQSLQAVRAEAGVLSFREIGTRRPVMSVETQNIPSARQGMVSCLSFGLLEKEILYD